jgi:hypothetical protein
MCDCKGGFMCDCNCEHCVEDCCLNNEHPCCDECACCE